MRHGVAKKGDDAEASGYFDWSVAERGISIRLSFSVIARLESDVMKGFWAVPRRGAEVGGVLFGRVAQEPERVVIIDDYKAVECEYRRGPSYVLSESDRKRLKRTLRKSSGERRAVGFYRSHTRPGLYLDQDDQGLVDYYFQDPASVFLLIRPHAGKPGVAGFFFREEGDLRRHSTYREFPFSRAGLLTPAGVAEAEPESQAPRAPAAVQTISGAARTPHPEPVSRPTASGKTPLEIASRAPTAPVIKLRFAARWPWAAAVALAVPLLAIEYAVLDAQARRASVAGSRDFSPALHIERNGRYLRVNWNRNAAAVRQASRGLLEITDGPYRRALALDSRQLQTGSFAHSPAGSDVSFRLELVAANTLVSESLRVVENPALSRPEPASEARAANTRIDESLRVAVNPASARPEPQAEARDRSPGQRIAAATSLPSNDLQNAPGTRPLSPPPPPHVTAGPPARPSPVRRAPMREASQRWFDDGL